MVRRLETAGQVPGTRLLRCSVQVIAAALWIFSMRAADCGELLLLAWLVIRSQQHPCLIKDWRSLQAALVSDVIFVMNTAACCVVVRVEGEWMRLGRLGVEL